MSYKLHLDIFEGPLDLLLYLIKKNDIDICDIPIKEITEQYMQYIELMKVLDLEMVGDFLVMAATLMQIKSKMLLPPDPSEETVEEDPRDELVRRLQEYKKFKEIAEQLKLKEQKRQDYFPRGIDEEQKKELEEDAKEVYFEANLFDLITAFTDALNKLEEEPAYKVTEENFTVEDKIHEILHTLVKVPQVRLSAIFSRARSKLEMIVSFMAVLELIRLKEIRVLQKRLFSDIDVVLNKEKLEPGTPSEPSEEFSPEPTEEEPNSQ